ncbi:M20/M25/M40 family metallo-hydrolase [Microlunatus sp. Gsoil 973]|nr:M20/M25/M40 family metallo-hydrolase [Microlunatus sp. Gsoil 973]
MLTEAAEAELPGLVQDLMRLAAIPSIAAEGFDPEALFTAHDQVVGLLTASGVTDIGRLEVPGTTAPIVSATVPGPPGSPAVLLYTHYDVVPAGDPALWRSPPFEPAVDGDAIVGRGVADSKANIVSIAGALRLLRDRLPVTVKIIIEGHEEFGSPFDDYPKQAPELFAADAIVIADVGNVRPGTPTMTVALRGSASVTISATSLLSDKHSGQYGGAAPDARLALIRAIGSLHDDAGDVVVPGLRREPWAGTSYTDDEFRRLAEVVDGVPLQGTGTIGERIWSGPAITVIAFDAPPIDSPLNAVAGSATAVLNLRVHPEQDAAEAQQALINHLRSLRPFGIELEVTAGETGNGFAAALDGAGYQAASQALAAVWGQPTGAMASGGSIPLAMAFQEADPQTEILLFGATDGYANIHGPNERVLISEIRNSIVGLALFLINMGAGPRSAQS